MRPTRREPAHTSFHELMNPTPSDGGDTVPIEPQPGADSDESFLDDEDYLPQERRGPSWLTVVLVTVLVLAVGCLGGIWIQKQFGAASAASGLPGGAQGFPGGRPTGGFPGGGQRPSSGTGFPGGNAPGDQPGGSASTGGSTEADTPVVVGTVTSVKSKAGGLVVKDLGGHAHQVKVSSSTTVTMPYAHGELKAGDTVSIVGTASGEIVTASAITVR